jgi:hypothetical protein
MAVESRPLVCISRRSVSRVDVFISSESRRASISRCVSSMASGLGPGHRAPTLIFVSASTPNRRKLEKRYRRSGRTYCRRRPLMYSIVRPPGWNRNFGSVRRMRRSRSKRISRNSLTMCQIGTMRSAARCPHSEQ